MVGPAPAGLTMFRTLVRCFALATVLAPALLAQQVHEVRVVGTAFVPDELVVCEGDTVRWTWDEGFHSVESGLAGMHDLAFTSGAPVFGPALHEVTFDAAFRAAHPTPGGRYDYYCLVHFAGGMVGGVTVVDRAARRTRNGSGVNPLTLSSQNRPVLGSAWVVLLDCAGHAPNVAAFFGYGRPLATPLTLPAGELLVDPSSAHLLTRLRAHAGGVAHFVVALPPDPALCGRALYGQGLCLGLPGPRFSNALDGLAGPP